MKKNSILMLVFIIVLGFCYHSASAQFPIKIPKIPIPKTGSPDSGRNSGNTTADNNDKSPEVPDEIKVNTAAPADYDAELKTGDLAIGVSKSEDNSGFLDPIRILGKSNGVYKVASLQFAGTYWYKANSVYPFFDLNEFYRAKINILSPYAQCYAQKHNLKTEQVGDYYDYNERGDQTKKILDEHLPKFAEMETNMSKLQARPNTFLGYEYNPAIWWEIITKRNEYMQCVVDQAIAKNDVGNSKSFIDAAQLEVEGYRTKRVIFSDLTNRYLFPAVSPRARAEWLQASKLTHVKASFDPLFDKLAAAAAQTLPIYLPGDSNFKFRDPVAEKLLMNYFKNPSTVKVIKIGVDSAGWYIDKNGLGIPTSRYKDAYVYVRNTADDHPYCHRISARIRQDYAGGGTYSNQTYRSSATDELMGCPAGTR